MRGVWCPPPNLCSISSVTESTTTASDMGAICILLEDSFSLLLFLVVGVAGGGAPGAGGAARGRAPRRSSAGGPGYNAHHLTLPNILLPLAPPRRPATATSPGRRLLVVGGGDTGLRAAGGDPVVGSGCPGCHRASHRSARGLLSAGGARPRLTAAWLVAGHQRSPRVPSSSHHHSATTASNNKQAASGGVALPWSVRAAAPPRLSGRAADDRRPAGTRAAAVAVTSRSTWHSTFTGYGAPQR